MMYECAFCNKLYHEEDGVMVLDQLRSLFVIDNQIYIFKCKNCMSNKTRKKFEELKKR